MKYSRIELKGYKRIQLNNIQHIKMTPEHLIQLILGTNGSGKSSLLREITPLPSHHTQYEKEGYKLLEMIHNGHHYQSIQKFDGKSGKYQLMKNGVDIFKGSTSTDYKSLIKDEFGITPEIQTLVDGIVKFSTMDVSKRRLWITMLSHADYTYAFQYYGRLKSRIRDLQGSLSVSQNRYALELGRVLSEEEVKNTREQLKLYQETINKLLELKPRVPLLKSDLEKFLIDRDRVINECQKRLFNLRNRVSTVLSENHIYGEINLEQCQQALYRLQGLVGHLHEIRNGLSQSLEEMHRCDYGAEQSSQLTSQELKELRHSRSEAYTELEKRITIKTFSSPTQAGTYSTNDFVSTFEAIFDRLVEIIDQIPEEGWNHFTRQTQELTGQRFKEFEVLLQQVQKQIQHDQRHIADMDYAKQHHERQCPKCDHKWYHGYDERRYDALKQAIAVNSERETELTIELQKCNEVLIELNRVFSLKQVYAQVVRSHPTLSSVWEKLQSIEDGFKPRTVRIILDGIRRELPDLLQLDMIRTELKNLDDSIIQSERQSQFNHEQHQKLLHNTEEELVAVQDKIRKQEQDIRVYEVLMGLFQNLTNTIGQTEQHLQERDQHITYLNDSLRVDHINRLINIFRQEVSVLEQTISKIDIQTSMLAQLKKQITEHEDDIRLLKLAEQAMSPSTGLIARGLTGFINWFITRMNQFVKHIWTYPLEILPVSIQDELELDYKFPIMLDHRIPAADIRNSECNQSTCDIFDLAFRIVAMECLGLKNWPLQLDEFGASFDSKHRALAFQVVTNLVTTTDIEQIFLVSHSEQSYGSLRNVDITALHEDNIVLPEGVEINGRTQIN